MVESLQNCEVANALESINGVQIHVAGSVTLASLSAMLNFSFLNRKMGIIIVPTAKDYLGD